MTDIVMKTYVCDTLVKTFAPNGGRETFTGTGQKRVNNLVNSMYFMRCELSRKWNAAILNLKWWACYVII